MSKTLYILRGVSGAGKSTFAKTLVGALGATHVEADMFHYDADGNYVWLPENMHKAHLWCQSKVRQAMLAGSDNVVVSNTSTTGKEMKPYLDLAKEYDYTVVSLVVENRHGGNSVHDVPPETIQKQAERLKNSIKLV